ncbi:MAG: hypothetical protein PHX51_08265 [Clostridia bacterium]|nr:hypothetical protein [Clostridia bacterium]
MTTDLLLKEAVSIYESTLEKKVELGGSQILFIDDSPEMLQFIQISLEHKFGMLQGFLVEPNPVFALHVLKFLVAKNVELRMFIKCAVIDIDFGIYNKTIKVNDLVQFFRLHKVPVILFSGIENWQKHIDKEYWSDIAYVYKGDADAMNKILIEVQKHNLFEIVEK